MKRVVINIRVSKNISGLVKVAVTSPAGLMKFFLNVEPCKDTCMLCSCSTLREVRYIKVKVLVRTYGWA